ncbi:hypothetical protein MB84_09895 [Pandoraea oxalativorans]|uniref:Uncharacterized protein n=1 Tax=Pandoraea oxalativorans TaxID=573737 RepID=A0A0E3YCF3_9BURK|nr:hypothetical protein MB84_09895 [Pandoraea oxalativorans]
MQGGDFILAFSLLVQRMRSDFNLQPVALAPLSRVAKQGVDSLEILLKEGGLCGAKLAHLVTR